MTTPQNPIGSGYDAFTTVDDVLAGIDLAGTTAMVTGGYSGLGLETTRALAGAGARVVVAGRSPAKAREALAGVAGVELEHVELEEPRSVEALGARFLASGRPLHILIHSAGIMAAPLSRDGNGNEMQLAVNHLAPFRLTWALMPALRRAEGARVVSMSSRAHRLAGFDFDDFNFERSEYDPWRAYGRSKTANALFAVELDRRGREDGVRAYSVHPGSILTDLARSLSDEQIRAFGALDENGSPRIDPTRDLKNPRQGAATAVWCATSDALARVGGVYCEDCDVAPLRTAEEERVDGVREWAANPALAERLWQLTERLVEPV